MWASPACVQAADARAPQGATAADRNTPSPELLEFLGGVDTLPVPTQKENAGTPRTDAQPTPAPEPKP